MIIKCVLPKEKPGLGLPIIAEEVANPEYIGYQIDFGNGVYTIEGINPDDARLFITKSTNPRLVNKDCRWDNKMIEKCLQHRVVE